MERLYQLVDQILGGMLSMIMALLVVDVLWQVFTRFILGDPSSFTEELARYLMIWVGLLGASYAAGKKMHLAVDLLPLQLEGRPRQYLQIVIELFTILFAASVLVFGGIRLVYVTFFLGQISAALQLPLGYVYLVVPLSGLLIMFYSIHSIHQEVKVLRHSPS